VSAHPYTLLDVFTDVPLMGNALAVVQDADGVRDNVMAAFARETRLSETTFVQTATEAGADYRNRIWTVAEELPFAGHPSLGTAVAVALARDESEVEYVQQTHAGLQSIRASRVGDTAYASVLQEPAVIEDAIDPGPALAALGLRRDDADPQVPCRAVSTGLRTLIVPVESRATLAAARPVPAALGALLGGTFTVYLVHAKPRSGRAWARCFPSMTGESEDPATGSAAGPLLASLHEQFGTTELEVTQGVEMNRPSRLACTVEGDRVRVGGDVCVIATGTVRLPA
jgi:trans-2,3-dihydro-3-hydroxyanthranilate isomerase